MLRAIALLWLVVGPTAAIAHDPGISRLDISVGESSIDLEASFALQDLAPLVAIDQNFDGLISESEWRRVQPTLESQHDALVSIHNNGKPLTPSRVLAARDGRDGIHLRQHWEAVKLGGRLTVEANALVHLSPGHRQFLEVRDSRGALVSNALLSARSTTHHVTLTQSAPEMLAVLTDYLALGTEHIWFGLDHLLFLATLLLPAVLVYVAPRWEPVTTLRPALITVLKLITAFTVAHSLTLTATVMGWLVPPAGLVEPAIALSVVLVALNNLRPVFVRSRWCPAFAFGLLHGFGFASVLQDIGLPPAATAISLLGFNLGVELGQLTVVALLLPIAFWLRKESGYRRYALQGGSMVAVVVASAWLVERSGLAGWHTAL